MSRPLLIWQQQHMAIGHQQIDADHRQFFDRINRMNLNLDQGTKGSALQQDTEQLIQQTRQHFRHESPLIARLPDTEQRLHNLHHKHFLESLLAFQQDLSMAHPTELQERLAQLADWYLKHILEYDSLLPCDS